MISKHFSHAECACRCGCGTEYVDPAVVGLLEAIRARFMKPVEVLSWCRCVTHNRACGGVVDSYHMTGQAVDIYIEGVALDDLAYEAKQVGADGIGIYYENGFVHVDVRGYVARWEG